MPAPLTGRPVTAAVAARHPIAVMIDDHRDARPQSGFSAASVVWQAPAEGGIPRYMLVFQDQIPGDVGPVRSARSYYIPWAAELRALYVHAGGSPQALATLRAKGNGQLVYNADEFRWAKSFRRVDFNFAPHNLYTTGKQLRSLAATRGARDVAFDWPWRFGRDAVLAGRPDRRADHRGLHPERDPVRLRPALEHVPPLGDRRAAAGRPGDEAPGGPEERRRHARPLRAVRTTARTRSASRPRSSEAGRPGSPRTG